MNTDDNNQDAPAADDSGGDGNAGSDLGDSTTETIALSKKEYDELKKAETTIGSMKRELKDLRQKADESKNSPNETKETPKNQTEEFGLLQRSYLASLGYKDADEVERAKEIQRETGMEWEKLAESKYFQTEMQGLRDAKANAAATDTGAGGAAPSGAKTTPAYWMQKGTPPTKEDVPDRKARAAIIRAMTERERSGGGTFYDE